MSVHIYNSLSGKKELLPRTSGQPIKLFVCGPTVYEDAHLGHARTALSFDSIVQYLRSQKYKVFFLKNITDVDDKIITKAQVKKVHPQDIARMFTESYLKDMKALGVTTVTKYARASEFIPQIVRQVKTLMDKGFAYVIDGDGIYFDISKFSHYGELSRRTATQAEDAISRIDESIKKRNRGDFALWKFPKIPPKRDGNTNAKASRYRNELSADGEPMWQTPIGWGRPGWHIEDTAITERFFGPQYDLHGGGLDLKFPHHEAEIAQQEAASGKRPFVKIWMHAGLLHINGEKMSKSLKNFMTIKDFLKVSESIILRMMVLLHHYRSPINYTESVVTQARSTLESFESFVGKLSLAIKANLKESRRLNVASDIKKSKISFNRAMEDDFNTPSALASLFTLIEQYQSKVWKLSKEDGQILSQYILSSLSSIGLTIRVPSPSASVRDLVSKRELCRRDKQFTQADILRKKISAVGYSVDDTPLGPLITRKR